MKILHIHPTLESGGIEAMICNLSNESINRHHVEFCSIFENKEEHIFLQKLDKRINVHSLHKINPGVELSILWKIFCFFKKGNYDVIHIHGFFYYYFIAIFLLHRQCNFFYTVHSDAVMENTRWDKRLLFLKKYCFRKGWIHPITISKMSKQSFDKLYGINSHMIYNGTPKPVIKKIDLSEYRCTPNTKIFFHPGRISLAKNQEMLCKVFSELINEGHDVVLLIAGQNQDKDIYNNISTFFSNRIIYMGERNDVRSIMASSDAFCLSSIWEGMPVTLLEALSVGCIPVCTPVGGIPEVIEHGISGFLSKTNKEQDYYLVLKEFLAMSAEDLIIMKEKVRDNFKKFDIHTTALEYERYYQVYI